MKVKLPYLLLCWCQCMLVASIFISKVVAQNFDRKIYSMANGLPGGNVEYIFEDSKGYLWVGAFADLVRFDGSSFTKFGEADGLHSIHNYILYEDRHHVLWGISNNGNRSAVIRYVNGKFETLPFDRQDAVKYIFSFYRTSDGELVVCTDHGLFERKKERWIKKDLGLGNSIATVRYMVTLQDGSLLICTPQAILHRLVSGQIKAVLKSADRHGFNKIQKVGDKVLITAFQHLFVYQNGLLRPVHEDSIKGQYILTSAIDHTGKFYISCASGAFFIIDGNKISRLPLQDNVSGGFTKSICEDREGNIWIGNLDLIRLRATPVEHFEQKDGLLSVDNRGLMVDRSNNVYFGDAATGFNYWDGQKFTPYTSLIPKKEWPQFQNNFIFAFAQDADGRVWMATNGGRIFRYKNNHAENLTDRFNTHHQTVSQLLYDHADSTMYIALDSLVKVKNDKVQFKMGLNVKGKVAEPTQMCFDSKHRLWMGVSTGNMGIFDPATQQVKYADSMLDGIHFRCLISGGDGTVWAGTENSGLLHFGVGANNKIVQLGAINQQNGLVSNYINDIAFDQSGWLWLLAADGLTRFNTNIKNKENVFVKEKLGSDDGLNPVSYVESHIVVDGYNNVWVSTYSGIYRFKNGQVPVDSLPPLVHIEKVLFNNDALGNKVGPQALTDYFNLPINPVLAYNKNNFTVYFNSIAFIKREELECGYMLEGLDKKWIISEPKKVVSYANLKAGEYVFKVRARRENGRWGNEAGFAFRIEPPYWETWWFRTLSIIIASAVLIVAFRRRIAQINNKARLQQQMQELEMQALKARMNPHFIYNAMNSIQSLVISDEPESAVRYIGKFAKLLRQVLDNSDKSMIPLDREISSLQLYIELEALRLHVDFDYTVDVDANINPEEEMLPPLVIQPYVENALWHGLSNKQGAKKLGIHIYQQENYLIAEIMDNGIGRKRAAEIKSKNAVAAASKGLDITRRRLNVLNNDSSEPVLIEDLEDAIQQPAGTKVTIRIRRNR